MATLTASRNPKSTSPLIRQTAVYGGVILGGSFLLIMIAVIVSVIVHTILIVILAILSQFYGSTPLEQISDQSVAVQPEQPKDPANKDPLSVSDIDPAALDPDVDINFDNENKADVSVPGLVDLNEPIGIVNGSLKTPPMSLPPPPGLGVGQGGALKLPDAGNVNLEGMAGGYTLKAKALAGTFFGRSGATKQRALREGGGTKETEAAVLKGIHWLVKVQHSDGAWRMEGPFKHPGKANDIAGTAFGLLPFLGAGKTHRPSKTNPFFKPIERALRFLMMMQDRKTGQLGSRMYEHCLATIVFCEAYGLTQDPALRPHAQAGVYYLVRAQHGGGGWRYQPGTAGDTSVTGWAVMALKSAKMAGLDVPGKTFRKAVTYMNSVCDKSSEGYGYTGPGSSYTMTAVGLLCRQYLQSWGPNNPRMIKGVQNHLKKMPPGKVRNMYYYYYATQVMHHFGGEDWDWWNKKMRKDLVDRQDANGSWNPNGDRHAGVGGRLMETSLCLLTLEVYYRYLPLYYREAGERSQRLLMGSGS